MKNLNSINQQIIIPDFIKNITLLDSNLGYYNSTLYLTIKLFYPINISFAKLILFLTSYPYNCNIINWDEEEKFDFDTHISTIFLLTFSNYPQFFKNTPIQNISTKNIANIFGFSTKNASNTKN